MLAEAGGNDWRPPARIGRPGGRGVAGARDPDPPAGGETAPGAGPGRLGQTAGSAVGESVGPLAVIVRPIDWSRLISAIAELGLLSELDQEGLD